MRKTNEKALTFIGITGSKCLMIKKVLFESWGALLALVFVDVLRLCFSFPFLQASRQAKPAFRLPAAATLEI